MNYCDKPFKHSHCHALNFQNITLRVISLYFYFYVTGAEGKTQKYTQAFTVVFLNILPKLLRGQDIYYIEYESTSKALTSP